MPRSDAGVGGNASVRRGQTRAPGASSRHDARVDDELVLDDVRQDATGTLSARFVVRATHPVLAGHFPGAPLVPGVLLLEAVRRAAERTLRRPLRLAEVVDVRFHQPLAPDAEATLQARLVAADGRVAVVGDASTAGTRLVSFDLVLA
jgi:3-hydroxyacyl-[acyl-carrier-protein] dehydratase